MRTLFLIRHAKSSWDTPGLPDFERTLNDRGKHDAPLMAKLLEKQGFKPDLLVSSPAKRALSTARFFAKAFNIAEEDIVRVQEIYEASPRDILKVIMKLPETAQTVLLFGHNPTFTEVANYFSDKFIDNVPTCGIVQVESTADTWGKMYDENSQVKACYFPKEVL